MSSCLGRAAVPVKRVWRGLSARLGLGLRLRRTTGLGRLRKEVRTCEYSDVHVMWEMLSSSRRDAGKPTAATTTTTRRRRTNRKASVASSRWTRLVSYCSAL